MTLQPTHTIDDCQCVTCQIKRAYDRGFEAGKADERSLWGRAFAETTQKLTQLKVLSHAQIAVLLQEKGKGDAATK